MMATLISAAPALPAESAKAAANNPVKILVTMRCPPKYRRGPQV
jgi:hypothetical protein